MAWKTDIYYLKKAIKLSKEALNSGNDGFASILVDADGIIVLSQKNCATDDHDITAHDAISLIRRAVKQFSREYMSTCTMYCTMEPCVMCMGAAYWANLGHVKFAVTEREYCDLRGDPELKISSTEFVDRLHIPKSSFGPYPEIHDEVFDVIHECLRRKADKK